MAKYAMVDVQWKDTKDISGDYIIKLSRDVNPEEDNGIFYYCNGIEDLMSLTEEGSEDFIVLKDSIKFLDTI